MVASLSQPNSLRSSECKPLVPPLKPFDWLLVIVILALTFFLFS